MWPLWLIIAVTVGSTLAITTSAVLVVVQAERKKHQKLVAENDIGRNLSQYHRPHLSITDVDFASMPHPGRNVRQSLQSPRRDSRFYSTMPSEDEIQSFSEGTGESLASVNFVHTNANRGQQWLNPSKPKKLEKRKRKSIQLSISAPMARSPMSAITEQTESVRQSSAEPVELPVHTTPRVTPERVIVSRDPLPMQRTHTSQSSVDSTIDQRKRENRISTRINDDNTQKSRSVSMGSIAPPPNCPLPPVPENRPTMQARQPSLSKSISEHSTAYRDISLLNSPMTNPPLMKSTIITVQPSGDFSTFNFGLARDGIQVVRVEKHEQSIQHEPESDKIPVLNLQPEIHYSAPIAELDAAMSKTNNRHEWNLPVGLRHLGPNKASSPIDTPRSESRPISTINSSSTDEPLNSHRLTSEEMQRVTTSRPSSLSSIDCFRQSVVGPNVPILTPSRPRTRGHKRQNCIRISGLTPIDQAKKRLSSQLDRLAEAEEVEADDLHMSTRTSAVVSIQDQSTNTAANAILSGEENPNVSKIRQPHALSLRIRRPGLLDREGSLVLPTRSDNGVNAESPVVRPSNPMAWPKKTPYRFVYAGSPSSDPTRTLPPQQDYSPVSPSASLGEGSGYDASSEKATGTKDVTDICKSSSPASTSILFSAVSSPVTAASTDRPRRHHTTQLHGPRSAPPPSLRIRNGTHISPRSRQGAELKSGSPIRKTSQSKTSALNTSRRSSSSVQDELQRKTALLRSLTHAATVGKAGGLPEINLMRPSSVLASNSPVARTPGSRYHDSPQAKIATTEEIKTLPQQIRGPRQRSQTVGSSTLLPPKLRQESTYPPSQSSSGQSRFPSSPSTISIWEDDSVRGDSDNEDPSASRGSQNIDRLVNRRFKTITTPTEGTTAPVEKAPLWKLQQNADSITYRALAFNGNRNPSVSLSSAKSPKQTSNERKISKLDGFWGDKSQLEQKPSVELMVRTRAVSNVMGPRQRAHTISAAPPKVRYMQLSTFKTEQNVVGLGLDFGRPVPAAASSVKTDQRLGSGGSVFLNDMERDGIGKLR